jgi:mannitol-1-phosphate 5-dehydrogenase
MKNEIRRDKIVIFGAGKIGRSFIGQLFSRGGYEVVFIDVFQPVIDELNRRGNYNVIIKAQKEEVLVIRNVRGVIATDRQAVAEEVATAGLIAVCVGLSGLSGLFPSLAEGLIKRMTIDEHAALDIIIAENMRNADSYFHAELAKVLPAGYPLDRLVGLVETSIGKMVPIMLKKDMEEDILQVFAEPYNTLILDQKGFRNAVPDIAGLFPKENMKAWVDRKSFIHNLGHAAAAYIGYLYDPRLTYLYEALAFKDILDPVRNAMKQSAGVLMAKYPGEFTMDDLVLHIDDLLIRFQNKALGDTLFRIGCDLPRKLGPEDRLAGAIKTAIRYRMPYDSILFALVCGCHFRAADEHGNLLPQDAEFARLSKKGISHILSTICGFNESENSGLFAEARQLELQVLSRQHSD